MAQLLTVRINPSWQALTAAVAKTTSRTCASVVREIFETLGMAIIRDAADAGLLDQDEVEAVFRASKEPGFAAAHLLGTIADRQPNFAAGYGLGDAASLEDVARRDRLRSAIAVRFGKSSGWGDVPRDAGGADVNIVFLRQGAFGLRGELKVVAGEIVRGVEAAAAQRLVADGIAAILEDDGVGE